jgi:hypothetical protein
MKPALIALLLLSTSAQADPPMPFSPNGYWPTGIFNPHCPNQYEYVLEPGHVWLGCWGQRD